MSRLIFNLIFAIIFSIQLQGQVVSISDTTDFYLSFNNDTNTVIFENKCFKVPLSLDEKIRQVKVVENKLGYITIVLLSRNKNYFLTLEDDGVPTFGSDKLLYYMLTYDEVSMLKENRKRRTQ